VAWEALLATCGVLEPPGIDVDWAAQSLRVLIGTGEGCSVTNGTMWLERCDDGDHLGAYFYVCGPCEAAQARMTVVPIDKAIAPPAVHSCVPYDLRCES
jgi:hypothetical protein